MQVESHPLLKDAAVFLVVASHHADDGARARARAPRVDANDVVPVGPETLSRRPWQDFARITADEDRHAQLARDVIAWVEQRRE